MQKHSTHFYYAFFDINTSAKRLVGEEKVKYFDNNYCVFTILKTKITYLLYNIYYNVALWSEKKLSRFLCCSKRAHPPLCCFTYSLVHQKVAVIFRCCSALYTSTSSWSLSAFALSNCCGGGIYTLSLFVTWSICSIIKGPLTFKCLKYHSFNASKISNEWLPLFKG